MNRRELIQAIMPVTLLPALTVKGQIQDGTGIANLPSGKYLLFVDSRAIDWDALRQAKCPEGVEIEVIQVTPQEGQSIQDAVALYNLEDAPNQE